MLHVRLANSSCIHNNINKTFKVNHRLNKTNNLINERFYSQKKTFAQKILDSSRRQLREAKDYQKLQEEFKENSLVKDLLLKESEEIAKQKKKSKYQDLFPGEEDIPSEATIIMNEIDRDYEELEKVAGYALHDPDFLLYDSVMNHRIKAAELAWMQDESEPMSKDAQLKLRSKIEEIVARTEAEFDQHLALFEHGTEVDIELSRKRFLDELGGDVVFFNDDTWKTQLLKPEYDPSQNPYLEDEVMKILGMSHTQNAAERALKDENILYKDYDQLIKKLDSDLPGYAGTADRILAHLELEKDKKLQEKLRERDEKSFDKYIEEEAYIMEQFLDEDKDDGDIDFGKDGEDVDDKEEDYIY